MKTKFTYKIIYLFVMIMFISLFIGANCISSTCPPMEEPPCESDEECIEEFGGNYQCLNLYHDGYHCRLNECLQMDCGKGNCVINQEDRNYNDDSYLTYQKFYCECDQNAVLYEGVCIPTCDGFSEECSNFNVKLDIDDYKMTEFPECNVELGRCDYICQGENSCKEGYSCIDEGYSRYRCKKDCIDNNDCEEGDYCYDNYCKETSCRYGICGKGECVADYNEEKQYYCECGEDAVLHLDVCVPTCNGFSQECKDFKLRDITECNIRYGHCDTKCSGDESCETGYICDYDVEKCIKACSQDNECSGGDVCRNGHCSYNRCDYFDCEGGTCFYADNPETDEVENIYCQCPDNTVFIDGKCTKICQEDQTCEFDEYCKENLCIDNPCYNKCDLSTQECIIERNYYSGEFKEYWCKCNEGMKEFEGKCYFKCEENDDCKNVGHINEGSCNSGMCGEYCKGQYIPLRTCNEGYFCSDETGKCEELE